LRKQALLFFEKKKQKTFIIKVSDAGYVPPGAKVFWFFFAKKNILACLRATR